MMMSAPWAAAAGIKRCRTANSWSSQRVATSQQGRVRLGVGVAEA
jgi:hypothetical protein